MGEDLRPGRELDALVAERVTKLSWHPDYPGDLPYYSTDISAAWEVIEQVYKDGHGWMLVGPNFDDTKWHAYESTGCADPDYGDWYELDGDTAPHAICLAALKAVT